MDQSTMPHSDRATAMAKERQYDDHNRVRRKEAVKLRKNRPVEPRLTVADYVRAFSLTAALGEDLVGEAAKGSAPDQSEHHHVNSEHHP